VEVVGYGLIVLLVGGALVDFVVWRRGRQTKPTDIRRAMHSEGFTPEQAEMVVRVGRPMLSSQAAAWTWSASPRDSEQR